MATPEIRPLPESKPADNDSSTTRTMVSRTPAPTAASHSRKDVCTSLGTSGRGPGLDASALLTVLPSLSDMSLNPFLDDDWRSLTPRLTPSFSLEFRCACPLAACGYLLPCVPFAVRCTLASGALYHPVIGASAAAHICPCSQASSTLVADVPPRRSRRSCPQAAFLLSFGRFPAGIASRIDPCQTVHGLTSAGTRARRPAALSPRSPAIKASRNRRDLPRTR